jgi:hypothetical protein
MPSKQMQQLRCRFADQMLSGRMPSYEEAPRHKIAKGKAKNYVEAIEFLGSRGVTLRL